MSLFRRQQRAFYGITGAQDLIPSRSASTRVGAAYVTPQSAMRHSAVWACLRLRQDLMSTFPVDVFRKIDGIQVEMPKPGMLQAPGENAGVKVDFAEWMAASQMDLDRSGNCIGLIVERNALNLPARIDLQPLSACSVRMRDGKLKYVIDRKEYAPDEVWHERQYVVSGLAMGLSPVAHAAWAVGQYMNVQQFAMDWYGNGGIPKARLKNTAKTINPGEATVIKDRWKATVQHGDLFVHGSDWEYEMIQAQKSDMAWIEAQRYSATDIARFFGCPSDLIDAAVSGQSVTYANMTQRNLQFLIMNLGPAVVRRENALSTLLPKPRFVKLNTDALLRMDPLTRAQMFQIQIESKQRVPSETRALDNLPPFTAEQLAELTNLTAQPEPSEPDPVGATS